MLTETESDTTWILKQSTHTWQESGMIPTLSLLVAFCFRPELNNLYREVVRIAALKSEVS
jgi:hypothetical protein